MEIDAWSHNNVYNNIDACVEGNFDEVHPCCTWTAQNNNLMTYSAWVPIPDFSAFTQCQLNKSRTHLSTTDKCNYVQSVNPTASASAIVSPVINNENCSSCIDLRTSMNGNAYKIDFYRFPGMHLVTTGWIQGVPNQYCWSTKNK